jgi:hypothetical protein
VGWNWAEPRDMQRPYDGGPIIAAWQAAHTSGVRPIVAVGGDAGADVDLPDPDRNNAMVDGVSQIACYQSMFGYRLEAFPRKDLRPGPVLDTTVDGNLNFKNPACYVFPRANRCAPGDAFRQDQRAALLQFAAYRDFPFARSGVQIAADWINLATLIGAVVAVLATLFAPRRRA